MTGLAAREGALAEAIHPASPEGARAIRVAAARRGPSTALIGMLMVIAAEGMLFAAFIASYFYLRFETPVWPPDGLPEPKWVLPVILVAVLAATSVPIQLASTAARSGRVGATRLYLLAALVVQAGYFAYEVDDFADQLNRFGIGRDAYSSIYYTLLGADHAHVFMGLLLDLWLLGKLATGLTRYRVDATRAIAWYWHFVNALTIVVLATLLSARA